MTDDPSSWVNLDDQLANLSIHDVDLSSSANAPPSTPAPAALAASGMSLGGGKPTHLILVEADLDLCLHYVGSQQRVCLRAKEEGGETCGTNHRGGQRLDLGEDVLMVLAGDKVAHATPILPTRRVSSDEMLTELLDERGLTASEWVSKFAILEVSNDKMDEDDSRCKFAFLDRLSPMATPWKKAGSDGTIVHIPSIHWEKTVDTNLHWHLEEAISVSGAHLMGDIVEAVGNLSASLDDVARETNDFAMLLEQGREKTETLLQGTEGWIGKPVEIDGEIFPMVWAAIGYLAEKQLRADNSVTIDSETAVRIEAAAQKANRVPQVEADVRAMRNVIKKLVAKLTQMNTQVGALDQKLQSGMATLGATSAAAPADPFGGLFGNVRSGHPASLPPTVPLSNVGSVEERLRKMEVAIGKLDSEQQCLHLSVNLSGVSVGPLTCETIEEL